jgi:hypothetical protein
MASNPITEKRANPGASKPRRWIYWGLAGVVTVLGIAALAAGPLMSRVEQPEYTVTKSDGAIEIRAYAPMIAAEAAVEGERTTAINEGFRLIAAYIFGANEPNAKIAMTAPVQQQKQTIAMTAPVTQQRTGDVWTVKFIMPKSWTMETLPKPKDTRVSLKPIPASRFAVVKFSGVASSEDIEKHTEELRRYTVAQKLTSTGQPVLAFYNPPWTLSVFRRNEVMLQLAD